MIILTIYTLDKINFWSFNRMRFILLENNKKKNK